VHWPVIGIRCAGFVLTLLAGTALARLHIEPVAGTVPHQAACRIELRTTAPAPVRSLILLTGRIRVEATVRTRIGRFLEHVTALRAPYQLALVPADDSDVDNRSYHRDKHRDQHEHDQLPRPHPVPLVHRIEDDQKDKQQLDDEQDLQIRDHVPSLRQEL
jgi:hypothetical protein